VGIGVDLEAAHGLALVIGVLEGLKELAEFLLLEMDAPLEQGVPEIGDVDLLLLVEL